MSDSRALERFARVSSVGSSGELIVNAGSYSRAAIIAAFEMNGGIQTFADWAELNKTEFYTKLFPKLIGREVEGQKSDDVEDLLLEIDADVTDVKEEQDEDVRQEATSEPVKAAGLAERIAGAAELYARGEPVE